MLDFEKPPAFAAVHDLFDRALLAAGARATAPLLRAHSRRGDEGRTRAGEGGAVRARLESCETGGGKAGHEPCTVRLREPVREAEADPAAIGARPRGDEGAKLSRL